MALRTCLFSADTNELPIRPLTNRSVIDYLSIISFMCKLPWMNRSSPAAVLGSAYETALAIQFVYCLGDDEVLSLTTNLLTWLGYKSRYELSHEILRPYLDYIDCDFDESIFSQFEDVLGEIYQLAVRPASSKVNS